MIGKSQRTINKLVLRIPGLLDMEYGPYHKYGLHRIRSADEGGRDLYLPHPLHRQAKDGDLSLLERAMFLSLRYSYGHNWST